VVFLIGITSHSAVADKDGCTTIKDGVLLDSNGNLINTGYDKWGYNYQARLFNGFYWNSSRPVIPWTEETLIEADKSTTWLVMKWSDTWLSNKDCNGDGKLDRGYSCDPIDASSSACEGAWVTNHQSGLTDEMPDGKIKKWTYFVKIVMVPRGEGAYKEDNYWFTADGVEIGSVIWGAYARILQISNDPFYGEHGVYYKSDVSPGFGTYK
ncbi:MAG: hypothetical protein KAV87_45610, partial [Desulfobacteraceae bacterium]|nr:hypothetical protein [Desulfobacteraceae bacterium]